MSKQILIYEKLNDVKTLEKGRGEDGFMRMTGVFGQCTSQKNRNGRRYVAENYKVMVDRIKQRIVAEGVPGQLEHPQTMNIDLNEVSHTIEDINIDEKGLVTGTIKLLNTPKGKIAQALVEGGLPLFISSRATGNVDKNGVVTLENIQTYDLVGTPGFANARLNLAESLAKETGSKFITESIDDNMFIVESESQEQSNKENDFNMTEQEHKDLLDKIDLLEESVKRTNRRVEEVNSPERMTALAEAIQNWVVNEYSPAVQNWVVDEASKNIQKTISESLLPKIADGVQNWMVSEMAPSMADGIQKWMVNEYANTTEQWMNEHFTKSLADGIQGWMTTEMAKEINDWMINEYTTTIDGYIKEHLQPEIMESMKNEINTIKESKENKLASVDRILEMLDKAPAKPVVGRVNENVNLDDPLYIREMPANMRPLWESADDNKKEYIQRKARLYNLNNNEAIDRFWESIDWTKQTPAVNVYEGLDAIPDTYERNLRAQLRRRAN